MEKTLISELNIIVLAMFGVLKAVGIDVPAEVAVPIVTLLNVVWRFATKRGLI
jgi:hypothetical protein